jgi:predicted nucleic acid-binding protein
VKELVVTNSTCLISLERIGYLQLLADLFEPVVIPPKVQEEFASSVAWLQLKVPRNSALITALSHIVGPGEAEAIALAVEDQTLLILDDLKARRWAKRLGVRVIGTVGVLLQAKRQHLIPSVRPLLEALKSAGFHMSSGLEEEALRLAGEKP